MLEVKNSLLSTIKAAVEETIAAHNQTMNTPFSTGTLCITDKLRHAILKVLVAHSDNMPHPASGDDAYSNTLTRWQILAYVAGIDLTIVKWFESHLDALSILHEIGYNQVAQGLWAVWAAEGHPLRYEQGKACGTKAWCSGANIVDHGLMTYRDEDGHSQLLTVDMQQDGIKIDNSAWQAVGMQATDTATIQFEQVAVSRAGSANAYLDRVGFWHGAAGVAACWYGATAYLAGYLIKAYQHKPNDYKAMYLGQVSTALAVTQHYFYHVAGLIDREPKQSHELAIRILRANVEQLARQVLDRVGQALGAAPFCNNAHFARLAADLPVFIRQSHGAFDLQKIGELTSVSASKAADEQGSIWQL